MKWFIVCVTATILLALALGNYVNALNHASNVALW